MREIHVAVHGLMKMVHIKNKCSERSGTASLCCSFSP